MNQYKCQVRNDIYDPKVDDPDNGVEPGTHFGDIPPDELAMSTMWCG